MADDVFAPWALKDFVESFLNILSAETGIKVDRTPGGINYGIASANGTNQVFVQSQIANSFLKARMDTATGDDVDTFVAQFSPTFPSRIGATRAYQNPGAPVALKAVPLVAIAYSEGVTTEEELVLWVSDVSDFPVPETRPMPALQLEGQTLRTFVNVKAAAPIVLLTAVNVSTRVLSLAIRDLPMDMALATYNLLCTPGMTLVARIGGLSRRVSVGDSNPYKFVATDTDISQWTVTQWGSTYMTLVEVADVAGSTVRVNINFQVTLLDATGLNDFAGGSVQVDDAVYVRGMGFVNDSGDIVRLGTASDYFSPSYVAPVYFIENTGGVRMSPLVWPMVAPMVVPVNSLVADSDGIVTYAVTSDPTHPLWVASDDTHPARYVLPVTAGNKQAYNAVCLPVQAQVTGVVGNLSSGQLVSLPSSIPGVDGCVNDLTISNGQDRESDKALKARFRMFVQGLPKATPSAVTAAIESALPDLVYTILENVEADSTTSAPGRFLVIASDADGNLGSTLRAQVISTVDAVRALGIKFAVRPPNVIPVVVNVQILVSAMPDNAINSIKLNVQSALINLINNAAPGTLIYFNQLAQAVTNVLGVKDLVQLLVQGVGYRLLPPDGPGGASTFTLTGTMNDLIPASAFELFRTNFANVTVTVL